MAQVMKKALFISVAASGRFLLSTSSSSSCCGGAEEDDNSSKSKQPPAKAAASPSNNNNIVAEVPPPAAPTVKVNVNLEVPPSADQLKRTQRVKSAEKIKFYLNWFWNTGVNQRPRNSASHDDYNYIFDKEVEDVIVPEAEAETEAGATAVAAEESPAAEPKEKRLYWKDFLESKEALPTFYDILNRKKKSDSEKTYALENLHALVQPGKLADYESAMYNRICEVMKKIRAQRNATTGSRDIHDLQTMMVNLHLKELVAAKKDQTVCGISFPVHLLDASVQESLGTYVNTVLRKEHLKFEDVKNCEKGMEEKLSDAEMDPFTFVYTLVDALVDVKNESDPEQPPTAA